MKKKKKKPSAAALARAAFDPGHSEIATSDPLPRGRNRSAIKEARAPPVCMLSAIEVAELLGVTTVTLWKWWKKERKFPPPRRKGTRNIGWLSTDVYEHLRNLPKVNGDGADED